MKKIKKRDFVNLYAERKGISTKEAKEIVENVFTLMIDNFKEGNELIFRTFGTFTIKETKREFGRNPKTGDNIKLTPKKYVKFKVSPNVFKK